MKQALSLVTLVVADYGHALDFFVGVLGFDMLQDQDQGDKRWVTIRPPGGEGTAILLARATTPAQLGAVGNQTGDRVGFFLTTDDFDRDYARMRDRGVTFLESPRAEPYGKVVQWRDPFGNRWDLLQPS